jgi:hypothetical protein
MTRTRLLSCFFAVISLLSFAAGSVVADSPRSEAKPSEVHQVEGKALQSTAPGANQSFQIGDFNTAVPGCFGSCSTNGSTCGCSCYGTYSCCSGGCSACFDSIGCIALLTI